VRPACPQAAIVARAVEPLRVGSSGTSGLQAATDGAAMLACDRAVSGRSGFPAAIPHRGLEAAPTRAPGAGIVPCIHALGLRDLARLAAAGCGRLIVATGDCDACPRGDLVRLQSRLADLARLLDSRGLPVLRLERLPADAGRLPATPPRPTPAPRWPPFLPAPRPRPRRRPGGNHVRPGGRGARRHPDCRPPVARHGRRGAVAPIAPTIDPTACTGCDACVRLCPQQAIVLERGGMVLVGSEEPFRDGVGGALLVESPATTPEGSDGTATGRVGPGRRTEADAAAGPAVLVYRSCPEACTGCGICVDVCADRAVRLEAWPPAMPVDVTLAEATVRCCRVRPTGR